MENLQTTSCGEANTDNCTESPGDNGTVVKDDSLMLKNNVDIIIKLQSIWRGKMARSRLKYL